MNQIKIINDLVSRFDVNEEDIIISHITDPLG